MNKGNLLILLHAHLPFVRHPEYERFMEEDWLFEAITETYIPLIKMMDRFSDEKLDYRLTMTLTPTLGSMLIDSLLQERYMRYINSRIELAEKEIKRTKNEPSFNALARMYLQEFCEAKSIFENQYGRNLLNAFKKFQDAGNLDIITCGATHGFLPNMETRRASIYGQIDIACRSYQKWFGRSPKGIWLPECGYFPGLDEILKEYGLRYFFLDAHGILFGDPRPKYGVFAPVFCSSGVAAFGRDLESSKQVWSAHEGYPGDVFYREFYRDIGFDLDYDYVKPYLHGEGIRGNTGIKYYRITGKTKTKEIYDPEWARQKTIEHAENFVFNREKQASYLSKKLDREPIIVSPYDAELFGHWWFEGPKFLEAVLRKVTKESNVLKLITGSEYLQANKTNQMVTPSFSSWGYKGYSEVWLDGTNDWMYRHLHKASERMQELANKYKNADAAMDRILKQAARELILAESSDWAFIMKMGTTVEYAEKREIEHLQNFSKIYDGIMDDSLDMNWFSQLEQKDNAFADIDWHVYAR